MRRLAVALSATLFVAPAVQAVDSVIIGGMVPDGEICEIVWAESGSPEEAAAVFIAALVTFQFDEAPARDCMTRIVDDGYLTGGALSRAFIGLLDGALARQPEIARSYIEGAVAENGYALPGEPPWRIVFSRDRRFDLGDGLYRVNVATSGEPSDRSITLRRDGRGRYRIHEASALFSAVAAPR